MRLLKLSTARDISVFMASSTDHVTGKTGLTLTITAGKAGAAFASITPTVTERGNGWYTLSLTASHTDTLGDLAFHITGSGADPSDFVNHVVAFDFTSATLGLGALGVTVTSPVASDGTLTIVQGDDYLAADGASIDFSFTGLTYSLVGASSVKLTLRHRNTGTITTVTGSVLGASSCRFEPTATVTDALTVGEYDYDVQAVLANTHVRTPLRGRAQVLADYTP